MLTILATWYLHCIGIYIVVRLIKKRKEKYYAKIIVT